MSNASLKEQLQAFASQLESVPKQKISRKENPPAMPNAKKEKKPKPKWLDYAQYGVELLRAYFPGCFKNMAEIQPLKKGIKEDLVKRLSTLDTIVTSDKGCMVKSLSYYVNTTSYLRSVVVGAVRIDLDGNPAGVVTEEEAKYSKEKQVNRNNKKTESLKSE